ncbi:MAG TPA: alpha/beta hydrolase [Oligoflexia bacterium]|nr:alpha/beta hydrolase [Oligoflexia bacterium]HMP26617.1 alpha/beta hydrolase [Oligoflexia bacterium]
MGAVVRLSWCERSLVGSAADQRIIFQKHRLPKVSLSGDLVVYIPKSKSELPIRSDLSFLGISGLGAFSGKLQTVGSLLAERNRIVAAAASLAGHDGSYESLCSLTADQMVDGAIEAALKFKKAHPTDKLIAFGHSAGGLAVFNAYFKHQKETGEKLFAGIILASLPLEYKLRHLVQAVASLNKATNRLPILRDIYNKYLNGPIPWLQSDFLTRFDRQNSSYEIIPRSAMLALEDLSALARRQIPKIDLPILAIHGVEDQIAYKSSLAIIMDRVVHKDLITIRVYDNCDHSNFLGSDRKLRRLFMQDVSLFMQRFSAQTTSLNGGTS